MMFFEFEILKVIKTERRGPNYLSGVVDPIERAGHAIKRFKCVFRGTIPIGVYYLHP